MVMADSVTLADIYALFQASQAEANRRFTEADRRAAEADRRAAEADRRLAESDRQLQDLKRIAANTSREVAGLTTRWGQFVDNVLEPSVGQLFQEWGIEIQATAYQMTSYRLGAQMEIDIFAIEYARSRRGTG